MYLKYSQVRTGRPPIRANAGDAIDIFIPDDFTTRVIEPNGSATIPSGLKFEVPFGYALMFVNKSGIAAKHNLIVGACLIDHGYSGELHIDIHNIGTEAQLIQSGMKIAQLIQMPVLTPSLLQVHEDDLYNDIALVSERGSGRMGSTGT